MMSKTPNVKSLSDSQIARIGMIAELDAINLYEQLAEQTKNPVLRETLLSVAEEEKVHLGEFMANMLDSDGEDVRKGIEEVCERAEKMGVHLRACREWLR